MASWLLFLLLAASDLEAARGALEAGRPAEAIDLLGDLADGDDAPQAALVVAGRAYLALGEFEAAVDPLLRASDAEPKDLDLARDAAYACWGAARGPFARAYLEDARRYAVRNGDPLLIADILYELGEFEEAHERYSQIAGSAGRKSHILQRTAECLARLGNEAGARKAFRAVLEDAIEREDLLTAYDASSRANATGRMLAWLDNRLAGNPDDTWARLYRGYARARSLLYPEAIEDLRAVLKERPGDEAVKARLAQVLVNHGMGDQRAEALEEGERLALEIIGGDDTNETAWAILRALTWHAWVNRDVEHSYRLLEILHDLDPLERDVALNFAAMARRLGREQESEAAYRALLEEYPEDPGVLNDWGILKDGRGDRAGAIELWERALEEDDRDLNALENLFTAAWERGDGKAMRKYLRRGQEEAFQRGDADLEGRWLWFEDRLSWAPVGHRR